MLIDPPHDTEYLYVTRRGSERRATTTHPIVLPYTAIVGETYLVEASILGRRERDVAWTPPSGWGQTPSIYEQDCWWRVVSPGEEGWTYVWTSSRPVRATLRLYLVRWHWATPLAEEPPPVVHACPILGVNAALCCGTLQPTETTNQLDAVTCTGPWPMLDRKTWAYWAARA